MINTEIKYILRSWEILQVIWASARICTICFLCNKQHVIVTFIVRMKPKLKAGTELIKICYNNFQFVSLYWVVRILISNFKILMLVQLNLLPLIVNVHKSEHTDNAGVNISLEQWYARFFFWRNVNGKHMLWSTDLSESVQQRDFKYFCWSATVFNRLLNTLSPSPNTHY